ncbi:VOC family protein [Gallaecimonas sp. GXIMD4217]|uniref:VOC family protein n=1 Tax=Gallaecimonas sp. GXIMD4217 TaxID=3131927 RepID=UPI00311AFF82
MNDPFTTHGAFSWAELMCDDVDRAKAFYGELFGWTYDTLPMQDGEYHVAICGGQKIAGIMKKPPQAADMPTMWGNYVTVLDINHTARFAEELGATILVPPTPIPGVGIFCLFQSPSGELLSAIQYKETPEA